MFEKDSTVFFIDTTDGIIGEAKFLEYENAGIWLKVKGQSVNRFVYSDKENERVFTQKESAEKVLNEIKTGIKKRLLASNMFIDDIINKLEKSEGKLYVGIIKDILQEKVKD